MDKWVTTEYMVDTYNLNSASTNVFASQDRKKGSKFTLKKNNSVYYNETKLLRVYNMKLNNWLRSHDIYYELTDKFNMNDTDMARGIIQYEGKGSLSSWRVFLSNGMWSLCERNTILSVNKTISQTSRFVEWGEFMLEGTEMKDFNTVDDYYGYWEAKKLLSKIAI